jgi:hypothetical protein
MNFVATSVIMPPVPHHRITQQMVHKNPLGYNIGNPVLTDDVSLYYIWYGNWSSKTKEILTDLGNFIGDSA